MPKQNLSEQLDRHLGAILAHRDAAIPRATPGVAVLLEIAANLRALPRRDFKTKLLADLQRSVSMATKTSVLPIPEGYPTATPYLCFKNAARAIDFYKKAFAATETWRLMQPDGRIGHAEIRIGNSPIMLSDEFPEYGTVSAETLGGSPVRLRLYVEDVDAFARQAVAAGAKVLRPVADQFYGDRSGQFADPFGYTWNISTRKEMLSMAEIQKRFDDLTKQTDQQAEPEQRPVKTVPTVREGFRTITPYIVVNEPDELISFMRQAFGAEEMFRAVGSAGGYHVEVKVGDSMLMVGGGRAFQGPQSLAAIHLYVPDADAAYQRAIDAGATSIHPPVDQPYGDREASVRDRSGNDWYIATHQGGSYIPAGLTNLQPYLHPKGAAQMIDFFVRAFDAEELGRHQTPDGTIHHATLRIGSSTLEMGESHGEFQPRPAMYMLYVPNVDAFYNHAVAEGAISAGPPSDQPYGRVAAVKDPMSNDWYIANPTKGAQG